MDLLSGGEKALTAVALIFSIFLIRPSPFCLLDEVDAPLDDANLARFNEMLRRLADRTQFLIVTHNKRSMEEADSLYGLTTGRTRRFRGSIGRIREVDRRSRSCSLDIS